MTLGIMAESMSWGIIEGWRKGPWTSEEDGLLIEYVKLHGEGRWNSVAKLQGLKRNGKSCRLRWVNYLRPDLKRGQITPHEETIILELHAQWGNRWSTIARSLPGRTDNEIKNYWRTHFNKKVKASAGDTAKSKASMIRKQQFQLLQQQQQQQQEMELKRIMPSLHDKNEHIRMQIQQHNNMSKMHTSGLYDQGHSYSCPTTINFNDYDAAMPASSSSDQDFFYDGSLWNLDDFQGNHRAFSAAARATQHSLATPLL